jgi:hypothetical protein
MMPSLQDAARLLRGEVSGGQILCPGPNHSDEDRSLSVKLDPEAPDGFIVHSFANDDPIKCKDYVRGKFGLPEWKPNGRANGEDKPSGSTKRRLIATYPYTDENGELLFEVLRYEPKGFSQRRPDGQGGWIPNTQGVRRVIYRLPEVIEAVAQGRPIFIVEGEKDADSLWQLNIPATTNSGGSGKWREEDSQFLKSVDTIICSDTDAPGKRNRDHVGQSIDGIASRVRVLDLPEGKDVTEFIEMGRTAEQLWHLVDSAPDWKWSKPRKPASAAVRAAADAAERRSKGLPIEPPAETPRMRAAPCRAAESETPRSPEPCRPKYDPSVHGSGAEILDEVFGFLGRFVVYPSEDAKVAHALWIIHTHFMDLWESTPRIAFLSPEPASGKTRALEVTELLVPRPVEAVNVTPAYLFRKVDASEGRPTILYDEIDTVFGPKAKENEEIRGLLNAGHRRGAVAGRCVVRGQIVQTEEIPAYCAVALAGLVNLPDTILTRAVVIKMKRRGPSEKVVSFRRRVHEPVGRAIRTKIEAWATALAATELPWPDLPADVVDRTADVWEALLVIADLAGGDWPQRAREAAVALVAAARNSTPSLRIQLLIDLHKIFQSNDKLPTDTILSRLCNLTEAPWGDLRGKPITDRVLAAMLGEYDISSVNIRTDVGVRRGYRREDLHDAWERYLPSRQKSATSATPATEPVFPEESVH